MVTQAHATAVPRPSVKGANAARRHHAEPGNGKAAQGRSFDRSTIDQPGKHIPTGPVVDSAAAPKISARNVNLWYGEKQALFDVSLDITEREVTALIGPSGCGKSTFLRCLNRMNDVIDICRVEGDIRLDGEDVYDRGLDVVHLRARVGMVFQKPNPFPTSLTGRAFMASPAARASSMRLSRPACAGQASGRRCTTVSRSPAPAFRVASSSGSASRARSPSAPR